MSWVSLLEIIYPVGAFYISNSATSPSSIIGGTWTKVSGAVLAATGSNSFATSGSYGGSLAMSINQMPNHNHEIWTIINPEKAVYHLSAAPTIAPTPSDRITSGLGGTHLEAKAVGGGKNFLPYHFSMHVWYRTA